MGKRYLNSKPIFKQPKIDWGNPYSRALVLAVPFNEGMGIYAYNAVKPNGINDGILASAGLILPTWTRSKYGPAITTVAANTQYVQFGVIAELNGAKLCSMVCFGNRQAGKVWTVGRNDGTLVGDPHCFNMLLYSDNNFYFQLGDGTAQFTQITTASSAAPVGDFSIAATFNSSIAGNAAINMYVNGISMLHNVAGGGSPNGNGLDTNSVNFWVGNDQNDASYADGRFDLVLLYVGRVLSPGEVAALHNNPWQVFQNIQPRSSFNPTSSSNIIFLFSSSYFQSDGDLLLTNGKINQGRTSFVGDGDIFVTNGRIIKLLESFSNDGNFNEISGKIAKSILTLTGDGNFSSTDGRISNIQISLVGDGNLTLSDGRKSSLSSSFSNDGNFSEISGRISKSILVVTGDGDFSTNDGRISQLYNSYILAGDYSQTDGRKSQAVLSAVGDGNLTMTDGRFSTQSTSFSNDGSLISYMDGRKSVLQTPYVGDGDLTLTNRSLLGGKLSLIQDGNLSLSAGKLITFSTNIIADTSVNIVNGRISQLTNTFIGDSSLTTADGKLCKSLISYVGDGNLSENGIKLTGGNTSFSNDGNLSSTAGKVCKVYENYTLDGDLVVVGGVIGFQFLFANASFQNDGDLTVAPGKRITSSIIAVADGDFNSTAGRLLKSTNSLVGDSTLSITDGKICQFVTQYILEGGFSARDNVLFGTTINFINFGDLSVVAGMTGFSTLSSTASWQADGDLNISPGKICQTQIAVTADGNVVLNGIRLYSKQVSFSCDGNMSFNGIRAVNRLMSFVGDADCSLSVGRVTKLQLSLNNAGDFFEEIRSTGFTPTPVAGNIYIDCEADLSINGGVIHAVNLTITGDGDVHVRGPAAVGLDYLIRFSLIGERTFNFSLTTAPTLNFKLKAINKIVGV